MKKLTLITGLLLAMFVQQSCKKENITNVTNQVQPGVETTVYLIPDSVSSGHNHWFAGNESNTWFYTKISTHQDILDSGSVNLFYSPDSIVWYPLPYHDNNINFNYQITGGDITIRYFADNINSPLFEFFLYYKAYIKIDYIL